MPKPIVLSDDSLKHWGLLTQPFLHDFFFRSASFKSLVCWLQRSIADPNRLQLVRSEIGSGITTALRQIAACGGMGQQAVDAELTRWTDQPLGRLFDDAMARFAAGRQNGVAPIWLIHAFRPSQVTALRHRLNRNQSLLANVKTIIRIEDNPSTRLAFEDLPTFSFSRAQSSELADAVGRAIRSAGATQAILDDSAIEELVRLSRGSFSGLVNATNRSLSWGHRVRLATVTARTVRECFGTEIEIRRTYRAAA